MKDRRQRTTGTAMIFTVTYRDQRGAKREEPIEAADRAACVAVCRARGI